MRNRIVFEEGSVEAIARLREQDDEFCRRLRIERAVPNSELLLFCRRRSRPRLPHPREWPQAFAKVCSIICPLRIV
jgi:hypothetical protein